MKNKPIKVYGVLSFNKFKNRDAPVGFTVWFRTQKQAIKYAGRGGYLTAPLSSLDEIK
jgi:hypothetical protein